MANKTYSVEELRKAIYGDKDDRENASGHSTEDPVQALRARVAESQEQRGGAGNPQPPQQSQAQDPLKEMRDALYGAARGMTFRQSRSGDVPKRAAQPKSTPAPEATKKNPLKDAVLALAKTPSKPAMQKPAADMQLDTSLKGTPNQRTDVAGLLGSARGRALYAYKNRDAGAEERAEAISKNLRDSSWEGLTERRELAELDVDWLLEDAEKQLAAMPKTDPRYSQTQARLNQLRQIRGTLQMRRDYIGSFSGEDDFDNMQSALRGIDMYRQAGKTANEYYKQARNESNAAYSRYQDAQIELEIAKGREGAIKKELTDFYNKVDYSKNPEGELALPNGQVIRGRDAIEKYREQLIEEYAAEIEGLPKRIEDADKALQEAAKEYKRTQGVYGYAKVYRYSDITDRPNYQKELEAGKKKYQQLQEKVETQRQAEKDEANIGNVETAGYNGQASDYYTFRMPTDAWTSQDLDTYYWLLSQSEEEAEAYAVDVNFNRLLSTRTKEQEKASEWAHDHPFWGGLAGTASRVATSPTGLWDYFGDLAQYGNTGLVMPRAELSMRDYANALSEGASRRFNEAGTIDASVPVLGGKGMGDLYQLGNSVAESLAWGSVGKGMGAVGAPDKLVSATINLGFFGNAASETTQQALTRGATPEQALGIGALAGAAEALGETMSVENLIHMKDPANVAQAMLNILTQAGIEGSEEGVTTLINTFAEALVYGDKSDLNQAYLDNLAAGMSRDEAKRAAWSAWAEDLAFDVFGGMLSGGVSAGAHISAQSLSAVTQDARERARTREQHQVAALLYSESETDTGTVEALKRIAGDKKMRAAFQELYNMSAKDALASFEEEAQAPANQKQQAPGPESRDVGDQLKFAFAQSKTDISAADMKILTDGYIANETDQTSYVIAMRDGYRLGKDGATLQEARKSSRYAGEVFEQQFRHAWELGSRAGGNDPAALRSEAPSTRATDIAQGENVGAAQKNKPVTVQGQDGQIRELKIGTDGQLQAVVENADGRTRTVKAQEIDAGESGLGELLETLQGRQDAAEMFRAYPSGMRIGEFVRAWDTAKAYGKATGTRTAESFLGDAMLRGVDQGVIKAAFEYGRSLKPKASGRSESTFTAGESRRAAEGVGPYSAREREANTSSDTGTPSVTAASRRDSSTLGGAKGVSYDGATVDGRVLPKVNRAKLTAKQKAQIEVVQMLSEKFGIRFVLFESPTGKSGQYKGINGAYQDGVIYLDVKAGLYGPNLGQVAIVRTAAHELTHFIKDYAPAQFKELQDFLLDNLTEWKGKTLGDLAAQKLERDSTGKLSMEDALEEVVADGCEMMLQRTQVMQTLAQTKPTLYQKVKDWLKKWAEALREAFTGVSAVHDEARAVAEWEAKRLDHLVELWDKGLIAAAENAQKSPARKGGEAKYSLEDQNKFSLNDINTLRSIRNNHQALKRVSIFDFTSADIQKAEKWARRFFSEMGTKSPFFRRWFGEWRAHDTSGVRYIEMKNDAISQKTRAVYNRDMSKQEGKRGIPINLSQDFFEDSIHYAKQGKDEKAINKLLANIDDVVENAVLLDTRLSDLSSKNKKGTTQFMHILYAPISYNGAPFLAKITVEEYREDGILRAYNAQRIKMSALPRSHFQQLNQAASAGNSRLHADEIMVSQLYDLVKQYDADLKPRPDVDPSLLNKDGTPKVFYHGTNAEFWAFDKKKATDKTGRLLGLGAGKGKFYLTEYQASAAMAASGAKARTGKGAERVMQLYVRAEKVMPRADYTKILDKYYQSIPNSRPGSAQYDYKQRDKAIAATDREVKAQGYDAVYDAGSGELFVYEASQMKSATDNIGTFDQSNPDIRFQERDDLPTDRELLMAARTEGRNAETLTAYQKKVRSLEALERKLQRQMDALEEKKKEAQEAAAELGKAEGEKAFGGFTGYAEREEKASKSKALRETVKNMREEISETEKRIKQAEAELADVEKTPEMQEETEKALADWRNANPHDAAKVIRELLQEQDTQKRYIDLLRRTDARVKSADVSALASTLLKENESSADIKSIEARLQRLGDYIVNHKDGAGTDFYGTIRTQAYRIAYNIMENSSRPEGDPNRGLRAWSFAEKKMVTEYLTDEIIDRIMSGEVREDIRIPTPTNEDMNRLVAERVHELRERSIERDKQYRARIAIDKKVVSLSKIMLENSGKRHVPDAWKESIGGFLASIDTLTQHSGEKSRSFHVKRIQKLREMVEKQQAINAGQETVSAGQETEGDQQKNKGPQVFFDLNPYIADLIKPFVDLAVDSSTGTIEVQKLTLVQMQQLEEILTGLREAVDKADQLLAATEKGQLLSGVAGETIRYLESLGKGKTGGILRRFLSWDNTTPVFFFKRFGAGGEAIFRGLQRGWGKLAFNARQIIEFSEKTYTAKEAREWEKEIHEFKLIKRESDLSGRESLTKAAKEGGPEAVKEAEERNKETVKLSTAQLMGIYCLAKREQAAGHILGGGIRIWDINEKPTLKERITGKSTQEQAERYLVTEEDLAEMEKALTPRQKEVADALQKYMNTVGTDWGNEVSQARYGVDLFTEKNYYPITTDPQSRNVRSPEADGSDLFHILNMGFTKKTVEYARNGIVIHSIFDVFAGHMADMAKYNSMGLPMLDAMKWINYLDESDGSFTSVRKAMETAYGKNAEKYFLAFIQDLNGSFEGGRRGEDLASKLISHSKVASVGANLRVAALQPTSYVRALAVLDPKYMYKPGNIVQIKQGIEEAQKYSGTAVWKDLGFFDMNINRNIRDLIKHTDGAMETIREASMKGAELGDKLTWGRLWNATKAEVRAKTGLSGEALLKATAERFDDVIYQTQVMDSTMTRSHLMRQKGAYASMVTSFMSEPTLSYNLLLDAVSNWQTAKRSGKGLQAAGKYAARAFAVYAISQVITSIAESIFDAFRDDDDYEKWWQKFLQAEFGWDGNLWQDLAPYNKLPFLRDAVSIFQGFSNKRMDTEWLEYWMQAINAFKKDVGEGSITWGTAYKCMRALGTLTGLPFSNAARDGIALWNTFVVGSSPDFQKKTIKRTAVKPLASIKQAYQAGALSEEAAIRYMLRDAGIESEDKARQKIREWSLEKGEKTYDQLLGALRSGKDGKAQREELLQSGYSEDAINNAVREAAKAWFQGTAEDGKPRIGKEEAVRILVNQGGMKQEDAEARVREWTCYVSSPEKLQYSEIQDAFLNGEITESRAAEMRALYGGKSKEDAKAEVREWACEKETGIRYKDIDDAYLGGEITERRAVEMLTLYGGKSKDEAQAQIYQWKFAGMDEDFQNITESAAKYYYEQAEKTGMSEGVFHEAWSALKDIKAGDDTKKNRVAYIAKLNIPARQKDSLFLLYYKESGLKDTPWH